MWVYRQARGRTVPTWTVGYFQPDGNFYVESEFDDPGIAARRVRWLSGGSDPIFKLPIVVKAKKDARE